MAHIYLPRVCKFRGIANVPVATVIDNYPGLGGASFSKNSLFPSVGQRFYDPTNQAIAGGQLDVFNGATFTSWKVGANGPANNDGPNPVWDGDKLTHLFTTDIQAKDLSCYNTVAILNASTTIPNPLETHVYTLSNVQGVANAWSMTNSGLAYQIFGPALLGVAYILVNPETGGSIGVTEDLITIAGGEEVGSFIPWEDGFNNSAVFNSADAPHPCCILKTDLTFGGTVLYSLTFDIAAVDDEMRNGTYALDANSVNISGLGFTIVVKQPITIGDVVLQTWAILISPDGSEYAIINLLPQDANTLAMWTNGPGFVSVVIDAGYNLWLYAPGHLSNVIASGIYTIPQRLSLRVIGLPQPIPLIVNPGLYR